MKLPKIRIRLKRQLLDKKEAADRSITRASGVYAENTAVRAMVNAIPYVGSSLDVVFASKGQKVVQERILQMLRDLRDEMSSVQGQVIDKGYLESEEWLDLVVKAMEAAAKTRNREKIRLYAKILRGAVTNQGAAEFVPEDYLAVLGELAPREVEVAKAIYQQQNDFPLSGETELQWAQRKGWDKLPEHCPSVPREDISFVLLRLQRAGLIHEITGAYLDYGGGVYVITAFFRNLTKFIEE